MRDRVKEEQKREPVAFGRTRHPVWRRAVPPIRHPIPHVPDVAQEGAVNGRRSDPARPGLYLQLPFLVLLQDGQNPRSRYALRHPSARTLLQASPRNVVRPSLGELLRACMLRGRAHTPLKRDRRAAQRRPGLAGRRRRAYVLWKLRNSATVSTVARTWSLEGRSPLSLFPRVGARTPPTPHASHDRSCGGRIQP